MAFCANNFAGEKREHPERQILEASALLSIAHASFLHQLFSRLSESRISFLEMGELSHFAAVAWGCQAYFLFWRRLDSRIRSAEISLCNRESMFREYRKRQGTFNRFQGTNITKYFGIWMGGKSVGIPAIAGEDSHR